jgi:TetR/AcrR family transcriptional regulator, regulator of cefoperazone and chloramphenicol sensitivity
MNEHDSPQTRILLATVNCINEVGIQDVTVRRIADLAEVNVAAINYYFRSKDRLIEAAMEQTMHNAFDELMDIIRDRKRPIRVRFREILREMVAGVDANPGITRAQLYGPVVEGDADALTTGWFSRFFELVSAETMIVLPSVSSVVIQAGLVEMFAAAMFVPLAEPMFATIAPFDLKGEDGRHSFVDHLLDTFFRTLGDKRS